MKILLTGCCGFIGFNFVNSLVKTNKKIKIVGIDNLNNYYSVGLKKARLKILLKSKNFTFQKMDLENLKLLNNLFKKNKFDCIFHLAAQAGVRYSIENPKKYIDSNIVGFFNIIELARKTNIKKIFYASSSSVYGDSKKFPLNEKTIINPKNTYGLTKKFNEELAEVYSNYYDINFVGLRFFTVYGEWGRPDMMILKYIEASVKNKYFYLHNYGNHTRDFTYIEDVTEILNRFIYFNNRKKHEIFNICSNRPIKLNKILTILNTFTKIPKIKKVGFQKADILKTHGSNFKIIKSLKFKKFTNIQKGLINTFNWYNNYLNKKL